MATIFLLGPGEWQPSALGQSRSPMDVRRHLAAIFVADGHDLVLMEDEKDEPGEDMVDKFDRLLHRGVTDIVVYWPAQAKMQTTYTELILLRDRAGDPKLPQIWILHHSAVASIDRDKFEVKEKGNRSRYLTAIVKLGVHPLEWGSDGDLEDQVALLSKQL
jgi:hypothetical protein